MPILKKWFDFWAMSFQKDDEIDIWFDIILFIMTHIAIFGLIVGYIVLLVYCTTAALWVSLILIPTAILLIMVLNTSIDKELNDDKR